MNHKVVATCVFTLLTSMAAQVWATPTIEVMALFSGRAMLLINKQQHLLKAGDVSPEGVTLISATGKHAVVEYEGKQFTIEPTTIIHGEIKRTEPVKITYGEAVTPKPKIQKNVEVIISADINDQYITDVDVNGHTMKAVVDTGANMVAMSSKHAEELGIDFQNAGMMGAAQTASGTTPMHLVKLDSVKVGDIEVNNVDAAVLEGDSPDVILLGMTFLNQIHLSQEKGVMKLTQKNQTAAPTVPATTTPPQN